MNWSRERLKEMAKIALKGSYWKCVAVALLAGICTGGSAFGSANARNTMSNEDGSGHNLIMAGIITIAVLVAVVIGLALRVFVFSVLEVGCCNFFNRDLYAPAEFSTLKVGFETNYANVVTVQFMRGLYTFLWSLLFVIPGIVKSYEYMMIPYLLSENPNMSREEAFELSKRMMDGEKMNAFLLDLSFIGWYLLTIVTCGLAGIFWTNPYVLLTRAGLYGALKQKLQMGYGGPGGVY